MSRIYTLDTASIIEISKLPEDVLPSFWSVLKTLSLEGRLFSPNEVRRELEKRTGKQKLHEWATKRLNIFVDIDSRQGAVLTELDVKYPGWIDASRLDPFADPLVVALAESQRRILKCSSFVITEETSANQRGSRKIPDVCRAIGLPCAGLWEILRQEGVI